MVVIVVIGVILIATAGANAIAARRNRNDALLRHERALAALRELSAHPDPQRSVPPSAPPLTDHVRILSEPPEGAAAQRRRTQRAAASRRATVRRRPRDIEGRPTAAQLPTQVANPAPAPVPVAAPAQAVATLPGGAEPARTRRGHAVALAAAALVLVVAGAAAVVAAVVADHSAAPPRAADRPPAVTPMPPTSAPRPTRELAPAARPTMRFAASAGGNGTVTVTVPFTLTMAPNGPCWVSVQTETGRTLYEGTLDSGQRHQVAGTSPLVVRLGNSPAMQLEVNGAQVNLAGVARTANVRFVAPT